MLFRSPTAGDEFEADGLSAKVLKMNGKRVENLRVIKLAPAAGIELDENASPAEKLKAVQKLMAEGDERAKKIYETIGVYFGYAVAYYALFYDIKHVLLMGRVSSGEGGNILFQNAQQVLAVEFPELAEKITIHLPDESSRRVGQSIAAASLPNIG